MAINWYKKALQKSYHSIVKSEILNNLGVAYDHNHNYIEAFNCYKKAAKLGLPLGQYNLAISYAQGHGTIQDYQEAYAWNSLAVAKGLPTDKQQSHAENYKHHLYNILKSQDKTGNILKEAAELSKQYFQQYVRENM